VRLARGPIGWAVIELASLGGQEPSVASGPSQVARDVLGSDRITLSDTNRWDLLAGRVDDRISQMLLDLAAEATLSVTVFGTGHPEQVFGTESVSNHTRGRGVDIWAFDGVPVSQQRDVGSAAHAAVATALAAGATEVGSHWDLDGAGSASFTNTVHDDHVHIAFDA
jgi:hypothetical protein